AEHWICPLVKLVAPHYFIGDEKKFVRSSHDPDINLRDIFETVHFPMVRQLVDYHARLIIEQRARPFALDGFAVNRVRSRKHFGRVKVEEFSALNLINTKACGLI